MYFSCNDHEFEKQIIEALGIEYKQNYPHYEFEQLEDKRKQYGVLPLSYLTNSQVVSSWIGGPHGWCHWTGLIGSNNYNIGKWPSVEDVMKDWQMIAEAFPFLQLKSQLLSGETCEESSVPVVQFNVEKGKVDVHKAVEPLMFVNDITSDVKSLEWRFRNPHAERGCNIEKFKWALETTKRSLGNGN